MQCHYQYTKNYCNWLDWLSLRRSKLFKKYLWMITVLKSGKIVFNACWWPPFPTLFTPLPFTTPLQLTSHPSSHHSSLSLLTVPLTPPQTTPTYHSSDHSPSPLPHTTHNSSLLPHTAPLSVAGTRNNVAVMIDHAFLICAVSLPVHKTVLQLDRLAKFMKEQFM